MQAAQPPLACAGWAEATSRRPSCGLGSGHRHGHGDSRAAVSVAGPPGTVAQAVNLSRAVAVTPTLTEVSAGGAMPATVLEPWSAGLFFFTEKLKARQCLKYCGPVGDFSLCMIHPIPSIATVVLN